MMIPRTIAQELTPMLSWFPVVSVTGPRQSGKIHAHQKHAARSHGAKLIIDEAQHAPGLFSQIQVAADERGGMGQYVLSGSQNFLMEKRIGPISGGAHGHASTAAPLA